MVCEGCSPCYRAIVLILMMGGIGCSIYACVDCSFMEVEPVGMGFYRGRESQVEGCVYYPEDFNEDDYWRAAQVFSALAPGFALLAFLYLCLENCLNVCCGKCVEMFLVFLAMISQGLSFLILNSEICKNPRLVIDSEFFDNVGQVVEQCELSTAAYVAISAACCFFVAYCLMCCMPPGPIIGSKARNDD